jgi:hypothetical protein
VGNVGHDQLQAVVKDRGQVDQLLDQVRSSCFSVAAEHAATGIGSILSTKEKESPIPGRFNGRKLGAAVPSCPQQGEEHGCSCYLVP